MIDLTILRNAGVIEILLYLQNYPGGRRKVDIRTDLGLNPATATRAHKILSQEGFLIGMGYENATAYALVPEAKKFVAALDTANRELKKMVKKIGPPGNRMWFNFMHKEYNIDAGKPESDD